MADFVADTHAIIWHLTAPQKLGKAARRAFEAADSGRAVCHVPAISLIEIALLYERGRLRIGPAQILKAISAHPGYSILPLDIEQAIAFEGFPTLRDPMDRLILAAAMAVDERLVSADKIFDSYGVRRIWD